MTKLGWVLWLALVVLSGCAVSPGARTGDFAALPAGKAYAEGTEIFFIHTEASDQDIADKLTQMMQSPVLYVPALAAVPDSALANVYVFENGLKGKGPLGFQADVFDNPPGLAGYSPLRRMVLVSWADPAQARELRSAAEILAAETTGAVTLTRPGVVINMPFVTWDGGKR